MSEAAADLMGLFRDEARQRLDQMDTELLAIESGDADAESVGSLFRHAHTIKGAAGMLGFDDIRALAHAAEDILAQVRETGVFPPDLAAPLLRATAALRAMVSGSPEPIGDLLSDLAASRAALAGEGDPGENEPEQASPPEPASPQQTSSPPGPHVPSAPAAQSRAAGPEGPARDATAGAERVLRVPAEKLDHLLDVTAEIMEYRSRLTHTLGQEQLLSQDVSDTLGAGGRLLGELRDMAFSMRLLPISAITGPLPRAVRDLARAAGKEVEFVISGADTELDRVILESLSEPLSHLLRNAIVHGIETPADRERASKPARGRVELRAVPRGSMVEIVIADDGRGVSPEAIEAAGREESLAGLLTKPGYSTAREVTDLAGRGVGLDAVKAYVNALGGNLEHLEPARSRDGRRAAAPARPGPHPGAAVRTWRRGVRRAPNGGRRGGDGGEDVHAAGPACPGGSREVPAGHRCRRDPRDGGAAPRRRLARDRRLRWRPPGDHEL